MSATNVTPIQCRLTFEMLARLRSGTLAAEERCVTPNAVNHRVRYAKCGKIVVCGGNISHPDLPRF